MGKYLRRYVVEQEALWRLVIETKYDCTGAGKAHSRVTFCLCVCVHNRFRENFELNDLGKRNGVVVKWYCMCKKNEKSMDHLLLHCEVTRDLWNYILKLFGVKWVMPRRVIDLMSSWGGMVGCSTVKELWRLVLLCLTWCF
jgi:hypothetical protein